MKSGKKLKEALMSNWLLKLASLLIAFTLWFVVIIVDDPVSDKSFSNIQVELVNTELLTDKGMMYEVLDNSDILKRVSFDAPKTIRDVIQPGDIVAEADFENLTATNTVAITFSCPKYSADVTNITGNISNVKLNIENKKRKWVNIETNITGEVADGYIIGGIVLDQNRLEIEGPESKINMIERAVIDVNVAGIYSNSSSRYDVKLVSTEGEVVSYKSVSSNADSVKVTVDILATKEVPVEYFAMGVPAEGYLATGMVEGNPSTVLIAGTQSTLKNVQSITIPAEEINVTGATDNFEQMVDIEKYLPNGIIFADSNFDGNAKVVVYIEKVAEKTIPLDGDMLQIQGVPEGFIVELASLGGKSLKVRGLRNDLIELKADDLRGIIDFEAYMEEVGLEVLIEGTYSVEAQFTLDEKYTQAGDVFVDVIISVPMVEQPLVDI
ncbi:MAG: hypothetical protein IJZ82_07075 [Lachnospiraceae bacterium]|nr:hypothetical protein [Lachnospiraceae bacterium]